MRRVDIVRVTLSGMWERRRATILGNILYCAKCGIHDYRDRYIKCHELNLDYNVRLPHGIDLDYSSPRATSVSGAPIRLSDADVEALARNLIPHSSTRSYLSCRARPS